MLRLLLCALVIASVRPSLAAENQPVASSLVDEVVAIVDLQKPRVILLSDVIVQARLTRARAGIVDALREPVDGRTLADTLDALIGQLVVMDEAAKLRVGEPTKTDVDQYIASLRSAIGPAAYDAFVAAYDLDDDVQEFARRELQVAHYLESRFRLASRPKESEVGAYVASHAEYLGRDPAWSMADAREKLAKERFAQYSEAFTAEVRRRARIRILHDPSQPVAPTAMSGSVTISDSPVSSSGR